MVFPRKFHSKLGKLRHKFTIKRSAPKIYKLYNIMIHKWNGFTNRCWQDRGSQSEAYLKTSTWKHEWWKWISDTVIVKIPRMWPFKHSKYQFDDMIRAKRLTKMHIWNILPFHLYLWGIAFLWGNLLPCRCYFLVFLVEF